MGIGLECVPVGFGLSVGDALVMLPFLGMLLVYVVIWESKNTAEKRLQERISQLETELDSRLVPKEIPQL